MRFNVIIAALLLLALCAPAQAAASRSIRVETVNSTTPNGKPAAALIINGQTVAQLAKDQRSRSPLRNISVAAALVAEAYRTGRTDFQVKQTDNRGRRYTLYLNGTVLLVATDMEGKAWGAEPRELAETWRDKIVAAMGASLPVEDTTGVEPPEPAAPIHPGGTLDAGTGMQRNPNVTTRMLSMPVYDPPEHSRIAAAQVPSELTAHVTGVGTDHAMALYSVQNAIRCHAGIPEHAGVKVTVKRPAGTDLSIRSGQRKDLYLSYDVQGAQPATRGGDVEVILENRSIATPRESMTFFSNAPERLERPQLLYYADLPGREAARLVYHHQNQTAGNLTFIARVVNTTSSTGAVHVIPGTASPDINTFYVGFKSAENFWNNLNSGAGYVLKIPAGGQAYIVSQDMGRGYTSSGYFKLSNLGDSQLRIETLAASPGNPPGNGATIDQSGASHDVYPAPYYAKTATFQMGDPWLYLRLGEDRAENLNGGKPLDGSYGMTYSYSIELHNPRDVPALAFVVLRASAGEVKGQFYIDNEYISTPLVAAGEELLVKEIPLRPGQTKLLRIKALPLNGGFYPASIIIRGTRRP